MPYVPIGTRGTEDKRVEDRLTFRSSNEETILKLYNIISVRTTLYCLKIGLY